MDKKLHAPLRPLERGQLYLHTRMCDGCRQYQTQIKFLDRILKKQAQEPNKANPPLKSMSAEAKSKIINDLKKM
ncbi:MAG: hypothetical protein IPJ20_01145 [Flammeovirgaceae bacterium]|nr:hypothetical protein [Flammeovirgaceae bacterium]